ncbi:MAG: phage tail protein [Actinomycetota bacterium]|nr:phage tail protein [Actinomycetota bacterium]
MTRGAAPGLASPHPLGSLLPALYHEDSLAQRFTAGLDDVLAPVLCVLDCLDAYVDPALAPPDFVAWIASWLDVERDDDVPMERCRVVVRDVADAYRMHGTARGIAAAVRALAGVDPEIHESGGVSWSRSPAADTPVAAAPSIRVVVPADSAVDLRAVERTVAGAKPAHVAHRVEIAGAAS